MRANNAVVCRGAVNCSRQPLFPWRLPGLGVLTGICGETCVKSIAITFQKCFVHSFEDCSTNILAAGRKAAFGWTI